MADVEAAADLSSDQGGHDAQAHETRPRKTRNRIPVSCEPCRIRRAKCDRARPSCSACAKRGEMEKCIYQTKAPKQGSKSEEGGVRNPITETEDRLRNLETLITQAVQGGRLNPLGTGYQAAAPNGYAMQPTTITPSAEPSDAAADPGQLSAILADLHELRSIITGEGATDNSYDESTVLLGASTTPSLEFILHQYLPGRRETENYLATYFRAPFIVIPIIHPESFRRQHEDFWRTKSDADPIWVGLLFAILSLAAHIASISNAVDDGAADRFTTASAQCLNLGGYIRPKKHLIPALLLLAQSQYIRRLDPSREVRMILAIVSQLAFQSGLHREPSRDTPVFEAEIRRRHWVMVRHFEVQVASQFGVPSVIPHNSYDVSPPHNLFDEDLKENMTVLPDSRDYSEITALSCFLIKNRLMNVLSDVYHYDMAVRPDNSDNSDQTFMRLDNDIRREHAAIPEKCKIRPISESYADAEGLVMNRLTLEFLAQKTICILHRRRMTEGNEYSRKACMEAASKIIKETTDLILEFAQGRQLQGKGWMLTSTIVNDFLLACMVLCLGVATDERSRRSSRRNASETEKTRKQIELLTKARNLCIELSPRSRGAKRVGECIWLLFSRLQANTSIDPQLPFSGLSMPAIPAPANGTGTGSSGAYSSLAAPGSTYLPTPTPSSTMSQERSTSSYAQALQQRYGQAPQMPPPPYDYAANVAAAAEAAPLPTGPAYAAAAAALYQSPEMMQTDPVCRYMMDSSGGEEIDWTAFDQYIVSDLGRGWSGGF